MSDTASSSHMDEFDSDDSSETTLSSSSPLKSSNHKQPGNSCARHIEAKFQKQPRGVRVLRHIGNFDLI